MKRDRNLGETGRERSSRGASLTTKFAASFHSRWNRERENIAIISKEVWWEGEKCELCRPVKSAVKSQQRTFLQKLLFLVSLFTYNTNVDIVLYKTIERRPRKLGEAFCVFAHSSICRV